MRDACLAATEETGRQLWGPARYAAYRVALDGPGELAAAMLEPGTVRFGLGPLTEVVAQRHTFAALADHLDATLLPVVAQERVLRGEDLRDDPRAAGTDDDPPLVLQPFEQHYVLPDYRADERLDGSVALESTTTRPGWSELPAERSQPDEQDAAGAGTPEGVRPLMRALEAVVAPWATESTGEVHVQAQAGGVDAALGGLVRRLDAAPDPAVPAAPVHRGPVTTGELLALLAHAGASGGVYGRRRGGAAGRSLAWWVARCATGLERATLVDADELEFRLEDLHRVAFRRAGKAAWRLEVALGAPDGEWSVALAAFDRTPDDAAP